MKVLFCAKDMTEYKALSVQRQKPMLTTVQCEKCYRGVLHRVPGASKLPWLAEENGQRFQHHERQLWPGQRSVKAGRPPVPGSLLTGALCMETCPMK